MRNHDEIKTQRRQCQCGHNRAEHEIHPNEHCYKCECKAFKARRHNRMPDQAQIPKIDPVCIFHGKKMSEHFCLYCCLCYKDLKYEECNVDADGNQENVCKECAADEQRRLRILSTGTLTPTVTGEPQPAR